MLTGGSFQIPVCLGDYTAITVTDSITAFIFAELDTEWTLWGYHGMYPQPSYAHNEQTQGIVGKMAQDVGMVESVVIPI